MIKTTARGCKLTLSEGSNHWHYKLSRGRNPFTISKTASPGVDYVTVNCGGRVKKSNFTIVGTPITVANVCNKNPGLGPHYPYVSQGVPTEYWTDSSGRLKLLLIEYSPTNIAVVVGPDGQSVAYFAYCNWQRWLTIAEYKAATGNTQSSNLGYLLQTQTDQAIFQMNDLWTTPSAGVQLCPSGPATYCDYEPVP